MSSKSRWSLAAAFILIALGGGAWLMSRTAGDLADDGTARSSSTKPAPGAAAVELVDAPPESLPLLESAPHVRAEIQKELVHVDPELDGWDSESINDVASVALNDIGRHIAAVARGANAESGKLPLENFESSELRPADLTEAYRDQVLTVNRWVHPGPAPVQEREFDAAIRRLIVPWRGQSKDLRTSFKIIRVASESDVATTLVKVQLFGDADRGQVQQNASWICRWQRSPAEPRLRLQSIQLQEFEEIVSKQRGALLADCTEAVLGQNESFRQQISLGIDHWRDTLDWRLGLDVAGPHGLAVGDVNGDGLPDLFVCEPGGLPNRLYVQNSDGSARDVSAAAGVDWLEPATSALLVDLDNDGDQDLVFTSGRFMISCENQGGAIFELRTIESMTGVARSLSAADYDNDGRLDVYVCSYLRRDVALDNVGLGMPMPYHDANNGPSNVMFRNLGDWKYQDVTTQVGLQQNNQRFSYAAAWEDYDNDGDVDLYVANDFGRNNLFQNENGKFRDVAAQAGVEDIATGMSVSWGDYNRDGHMDLYVGNMFSTAGNRVMYQRRFQSATDETTRDVFRRLARGNSLFANNGDGTFRDISESAGVTFGRWAWASMFADLNNDGWDDIVVANGMITSADDPGDL